MSTSVLRCSFPRKIMAPHRLARSTHNNPPVETIRRDLRTLLRNTAQPVAVVTSLMPEKHISPDIPHSKYHGATLSSFTSIALDPHPLVAFSLRIPSRMATTLRDAHIDWPSHMVINILSGLQEDIAVAFSRVDLFPHPFESVPFTLTEEGLPILSGSLGALSCKLVASSWPLHDLEVLSGDKKKDLDHVWEGDGVASELFIAQVTRVESTKGPGETDPLQSSPLLYYQKGYSTTSPLPLKAGSKLRAEKKP
ncbi:hypothetical protein NLI96_g8755 [Meripilus lineatus]|uniref:Flavin reductase like domain-containing protein n=1 Tax=Meripilus lineatus TaxID=2056292 RepID=A0AAD5V1Y8_9APHY|nr:hypothetical protein NLI96_g8755 [Physisporinus lineatus]